MSLSELAIVPVKREQEAEFLELMRRHHYLGMPHKIGESGYYAGVLDGRWVVLSSFNASALKSRARDRWIGWQPEDRDVRRHLILNQSRFLVLESIPNLASRALSLLARQVARDWPERYGHPLLLLETFVDPACFKGTCYRAAGWTEIGRSAGYRRVAGGYRSGSTAKMMWVRPLRNDARQLLARAHLPAVFFPNQEVVKMYPETIYLSILDHFSQIPDPRGRNGKRYRLETLLALSAAAVFGGARGYLEIGEWIQRQSDTVLRRFRTGLRKGKVQRPSVYCIRNALIHTDPEKFDRALHDWKCSIGAPDSAIAIDGKTLCGAIDDQGRQVHLLSAVGHQTRTTLAKKTSASPGGVPRSRSTPTK